MTIKYQGHEFKGTAGEWVAFRNPSYWEVRVEDEHGWKAAVGDTCSARPLRPDDGLQEANAKIFAAAPKLLKALIEVVELNEKGYLINGGRAHDKAIAAILQALGVHCRYHGTDADACKTYSGDLPCDPVK